MKQTYSVSGMTCNGCKNSVEKALLALSDINTAAVNLEKNEVEIYFNTPVSIPKLKAALPEKFTITKQEEVFDVALNENEKSEFQQLYPLFLIFALNIFVLFNFLPKVKELTLSVILDLYSFK